METVLCAVDETPVAAAVLYAAAGLACCAGSKLVVLRVADHDDLGELNELVHTTLPGWIGYRRDTEVIVRPGKPAEAILAAAHECHASLIVLGTHSRGSLARKFFGSVTASVLTGTHIPMAVVPPSGPELISLTDTAAVPHLGSVLVPIDINLPAARQLAFASTLSRASSSEVTLLHAIPPYEASADPLHRLQDMARAVEAPAGVRAVVTHGPLVHVILDRQLRTDAGVVVLGRDAGSPGRVALELLERTRAVVVFVP